MSATEKGRLVCKSSCHSCPALHRKAGPVAPRDNHSLAEGHLFSPNLTSNHLAICSWIPLLYVCPAPRFVNGHMRQAMCILHAKQ